MHFRSSGRFVRVGRNRGSAWPRSSGAEEEGQASRTSVAAHHQVLEPELFARGVLALLFPAREGVTMAKQRLKQMLPAEQFCAGARESRERVCGGLWQSKYVRREGVIPSCVLHLPLGVIRICGDRAAQSWFALVMASSLCLSRCPLLMSHFGVIYLTPISFLLSVLCLIFSPPNNSMHPLACAFVPSLLFAV